MADKGLFPKHVRQSSIDTEPKTLLEEDIKLAREAALHIINNNTPEDAIRIFLEGLVQVESAVKVEAVAKPEYDDEE